MITPAFHSCPGRSICSFCFHRASCLAKVLFSMLLFPCLSTISCHPSEEPQPREQEDSPPGAHRIPDDHFRGHPGQGTLGVGVKSRAQVPPEELKSEPDILKNITFELELNGLMAGKYTSPETRTQRPFARRHDPDSVKGRYPPWLPEPGFSFLLSWPWISDQWTLGPRI